MGDTAIEWADKVWNPVTGCRKISAGCQNCYASTLHEMRHRAYTNGYDHLPKQYAVPFTTVLTHSDRLENPLHWKTPARIFVNSMSDLFHKDVPGHFIQSVFSIMENAKQHTFMVLTKRADRLYEWVKAYADWLEYAGGPSFEKRHPNVLLGISVEDQKAADNRMPFLIKLKEEVNCNAFVSFEPLLGPILFKVDWLPALIGDGPEHMPGIDWAIVGGESGKDARPMNPDWARYIRDRCQEQRVPFFFKQHGEYIHESQIWKDPMAPPSPDNLIDPRAEHALLYGKEDLMEIGYQWPDRSISYRVGKKKAGRRLDGRIWNEFPE